MSKNIINKGDEMIKKRMTILPIVDNSADLEKIEKIYNFKDLEKFSTEKNRIKLFIKSQSDKDKNTFMNWGDYWVKKQLQYYFIKMFGDKLTICDFEYDADVVLYLFGSPYSVNSEKLNLVWFYSHPDMMIIDEYSKYDYVFCASKNYLKKLIFENVYNQPVYAGTDFKFHQHTGEKNIDILFVGNARSGSSYGRQSVYDLNLISKHEWKIQVFGAKWELGRFSFSHKWYRGKYISYDRLPKMYSSAKINLIDGHEDMNKYGFISAKVFDTAAAGGNIIMEYNSGIKEIFGDKIKMYRNKMEMWNLINDELKNPTPESELKKISKIARKYSYRNTIKKMFNIIINKIR